MFKLVVLSALFAAAIAEPGVFFTPTTFTTVAAPAATTYVQRAAQYSNYLPVTQYSNYLPAPSVYSSLPNVHYIKKRSAPFYNTYAAPYTYITGAPLTDPYASTYITTAPIAATPVLSTYSSPVHYIKKRSVRAFLPAPASYIAPAPITTTYIESAPLSATYSSAILPNAAFLSSYGTLPYIKK
ncbi:unnamed protein product [Parnassius apollo]|uniref:(apollo) hypothetical protein n=1 Tax=Parnassius apollo TaxID=110799 RepID=A0A8S3Y4F7_PARAO|nr:unnamed protein product [Parnassius apollo]